MELINNEIYRIRNKTIFPSNTYIYKNKIDDNCIIIDPGFDAANIDSAIMENKLIPVAIISTHGHFDHIGGVSFLKNKFRIPFYLHVGDLKISQSANFYLKVAQLNHKIETPVPDFLFKDEYQQISLKGIDLEIYNLPGHSPGSCIIKIENYLFSGDLLYKNGLGSGSIPKEDRTLLKKSVLHFFTLFSDENIVLPGHGQEEYIGLIKKNNTALKIFISEDNESNEK